MDRNVWGRRFNILSWLSLRYARRAVSDKGRWTNILAPMKEASSQKSFIVLMQIIKFISVLNSGIVVAFEIWPRYRSRRPMQVEESISG